MPEKIINPTPQSDRTVPSPFLFPSGANGVKRPFALYFSKSLYAQHAVQIRDGKLVSIG